MKQDGSAIRIEDRLHFRIRRRMGRATVSVLVRTAKQTLHPRPRSRYNCARMDDLCTGGAGMNCMLTIFFQI